MKKKLSSFVTAIFVLLMCVFASACGDKYKNLEFKVYYAFAEDTTTWFDASDGIFLNYGLDDDGSEDESSLVFDDYGATIYLKIEVQNVKAKHIDKITVSPRSTEGLDFSPIMVDQGQVFDLSIEGNVDTSLKLYENNSGKKYDLPIVISRKLEKIEAVTSFKPAMPLTANGVYGTMSLVSLEKDILEYYPIGQTNQKGVTYSVESIGRYVENVTSDEYEYVEKYNQSYSQQYAVVENGILKITNGSFFSLDAYIIRVRATSVFYDGSKEGVDPISAVFDVYVVDSETRLDSPFVKFDGGEEVISQINIYENSSDHATSTVVIDMEELPSDLVYSEGVLTNDGMASYKVAIYVLDEKGEYKKCYFENQGNGEGSDENGTVGINGLYVKKDGNKYTFSIASRDVDKNTIKIAYELEGFDYSHSQAVDASKVITVIKGVVPTGIVVNDLITLDKDKPTAEAQIFSINNENYRGLKLKLVANPNNNPECKIEFESNPNLIVTNEKGESVSWIYSGEYVYVKFTGNATGTVLNIKTLNVPNYYNEATVNRTEYLTVSYQLEKLVTADSLEFVANSTGAELTGNALIDASKDDSIFVKVNYSGESLVTSTINLTSLNDKVLFGNGKTEIELSDAVLKSTGTTATGKYDVYEIPVLATNSKTISKVTITAGDENFVVYGETEVESVFVVDKLNETINIDAESEGGVREFTVDEVNNGAFNFAIARNETAYFTVKDGSGSTKTIAEINLSTKTVEGEYFSNQLFVPVVYGSTFEVISYTSGKTQILQLSVAYYVVDNDPFSNTYNQIVKTSQLIEVQIAVFDSVGIITRTPSNQTIGFANNYYKDISLTEVTFSSNSLGGGTPSNTIVFTGAEHSSIIQKSGASQIKLKFNAGVYQALTQSEIVDIYYYSNGNRISLLSNNGTVFVDNKGTNALEDDVNILNGSFVVELKNKTDLSAISMTLTALRFGIESNTSIDVSINIAEVDPAERIIVDGDFTQTNELEMSFMNVADGGVDVAEFEAYLEFKTPTVPQGKIRFDDIDTALTYVLYRYQKDENGHYKYDSDGNVIYTRVDNDFLDIKFENGKVKIQASKHRGGGTFKLVLATKDSYNQDVDPSSIDLEEYHFDKTYSVTIDIADGTKQNSYSIWTAEDLPAINNNLDKHFHLEANIGGNEPISITPLGVLNTGVKPFTGSLTGEVQTIYGENKSKVSSYSIKIKIEETVDSSYGGLSGLFAIIGEEGCVNNLSLIVEYASKFTSTHNGGLHIGALAGINNGTINNVQTTIEQPIDVEVGFASAGLIRLGGLVGSNNGEISNSTSENYNVLNIVSNQYSTHSIGMIAGVNEADGIISGAYNGKESLNNYIYDVVANINVVNTNELNDGNVVKYYVGAVAGINAGVVEKVLVGGQISMSSQITGNLQSGALGGVVGLAEENSIVYLATAQSLNITSTSNSIGVGGVVGNADSATIDTVKYVSVITKIDGEDILGILSGKAFVGGVVANATSGSIKYSSVESFIESYNAGTFYTIQNGTAAAGLACASGTNVDNSFVTANIKSTGTIYLTTNVATEENTYFIGKVDGTISNNYTKYSIINGNLTNKTITLASFMIDVTVDNTTADWTNIYYVDGTNYIKASEYDSLKTYKEFDVSAWQTFAYSLVGLTAPELIEANITWLAEKDYNVVKVNGVELFFPYLVRSWDHDNNPLTENKTEPLLIVKPQAISAEINQNYVTSSSSIYVKEFNFDEYAPLIKESVVVNFFKDAKDEDNAHNLFNDGSNNGLLDFYLLPKDDDFDDDFNKGAQGGYAYEILGDGHNYAYINSKKQIVFTRASNQTPILVRVYSVFNPEIEIYVAFYSQSLLTELTLSSSSVYYASENTHEYEINVYTGQNNKVMALNAENVLNGDVYQDIFDVESLSQYLEIQQTSTNANSKLAINSSNSQSITLRIRDDLTDDERIGADEFEIITFSLFLKAEYFGSYTFDSTQYPHVQNDILIGTIRLKVNLYNSATNIDVDGSDAEITTSDDIDLTVTLTTEYVKESLYSSTDTRIEAVKVNGDGELCYDIEESDGIRIKLEIIEGNKEAEKLCKTNGVEHFAELFVDNAQILSSLYKTKDGKVLGYQYKVFLELKDKHIARYINSNIKFNIVVYALSNGEINNEENPIEFLLKPATLQTAKIENYVVKSLSMFTDYTNIVANENIETSIIEPGGLGNVMMIYLEPSYSQVTSVSIQTSSIFVPSLGRSVQVKFTQLALDHRAGGNGVFTTLSAERANSQDGDTLELNLISEIDRYGNDVYTGILCVRVHIEEPFVGLEALMTISLNVKTENNPEGIVRTRDLLTSYLPGTEISYNEEKAIDNGYLIQKGTSKNEATLKIYGYQFNSNPVPEFIWELPATSTLTYVDGNKGKITDGTKEYLIGDYVSYYLDKNVNDIVYNSYEDSYTLKLFLNVAEDIPAPFRLSAELYLATKDGQIETSPKDENTLVFYPTEYILNSVYVADLTDSGRKNIPINQTREIELRFITDSETNDLSETIYQKLLTYAQNYDLANDYENFKLASLFSYYKNGGTITFANNNLYSEFEYNLVNEEIISITGLEKFNSLITFKVYYDYEFIDGEYVLVFGTQGKPLSTIFTLNIIANEEENEVLVYTAEDIYNSTTRQWNLVEGEKYVLLNDIELEYVVPITTKIGSFDGNNRVISIKSFVVDEDVNEYGLFANIGTYTVEDPETEEQVEKQTILKNMIVDYSKFEGTLALNNLTNSNIVFGGLVGTNNGGLIYNCDVMNLDVTKDVDIDIIVASNANITFGGMVGVNNGNITNSRVGRASYTKITASPTTESTVEKYAGGLTFKISNKVGDDEVNQFAITAGGFVGENSGIISSSYLTRTNLYNYSTNETTNITAGFVGNNRGTISYSYSKSDDETITTSNPYATGYVIDNLGNGIVSGFVYNNTGTINNAYANIELNTKSAYISGFVYNNTGTISESYAATTMNSGLVDSYAEQPFVGVNSKGDLLSNGTLQNTYYLMRSSTDNPYKDEDKDIAQALNEENFQNSEYLVGFAFVLSNSKAEREQGIWSYYTTTNKKRILPELMNANLISHSYRFVVDSSAQTIVLRNAVSYAEGTANNPYTISNVKEFNNVFIEKQSDKNLIGYVRLINNINFNDDETAIQTRSNYTLGSTESSKTSIEGNGMTISGIYLDVGDAIVSKIGLFAEIQNAYVKNLNLEFATPKTDGQFSTTTAMYSGGLAGLIEDSAIFNITLDGKNTTLTGTNFVGGVAGLIKGNSLIYGIETNLNVKASGNENYLYYSEQDYENLNIKVNSRYEYNNYLKHLSYAGGVAGVLDLTKRSNIEYNVQFIDIRGDQMSAKTFDGNPEANIIAEYSGGVSGYASRETQAFKLRYFVGNSESVRGDTAVGGLFGVSLGGITASQVTADEDIQFTHDTTIGEYIIALDNLDEDAKLDTTKIGNANLLEGNKYVGGLIGLGVDAKINASYSKASISSGEIVGGLVGLSVAGSTNYSYAVPFVNLNENLKSVGGLIGEAYAVTPRTQERNAAITTYETLIKHKGVVNKVTDVQFTYSTLIIDESQFETLTSEQQKKINSATFDYICADYDANGSASLQSNQNSSLMYVYAGPVSYTTITVNNQTNSTNKSSIVDLHRLYNVGDPDQVVAFQEVFSGWALIKYWSLNDEKYFPLLNNEAVDNFIEIDHANDLELIKLNPSGKFKVVDDIVVNALEANWIISGKFTGVLVGELENDDRRPTITINGLTPIIDKESSGFFEETYNATISNLSFVWVSSSSNPAIRTNNLHITMVSGLTCKDENSLITNVEVRVLGEDNENAYLLNNATIGGFGGIVGEAVNTNILGCNFVGRVKATLKNANADEIYVGGAVAYAETNSANGDSAVINNVAVGAEKELSDEFSNLHYPITSLDLTISSETNRAVYIGGSVGQANNVAVASNLIANISSTADEYKQVNISINLDGNNANVYTGGIVGYASDGMISNCETSTNITLYGTSSSSMLKVGGLVGEYSLFNPSSTTGIAKCNSYSNISTIKDNDNVLQTAADTQTMLSTGVAMLGGGATLKQCLFTGSINTEGSIISILYAGGAVAYVNSSLNYNVDIEEVTTDSVLTVGTEETTSIYAGGLVGRENKLNISYSSTLGRIVPITNQNADNIYVGGMIGLIKKTDNDEKAITNVNNSYSLTSIVADSIADEAITNLSIGALVGSIPADSTSGEDGNINFTNVFYSSDYALFADENYLQDETTLGTNLSATTMIRSAAWHTILKTENDQQYGIWTEILSNDGTTRLPYLLALEEAMIKYGVLTKPTGATSYDYINGSAMRPILIESGVGSDYVFDSDTYNYYLLTLSNDKDTTRKMSGALNGILIGEDESIENTFRVGELSSINELQNYRGIISRVKEHSAISNLHVVLDSEISISANEITGIITGLNEGVIFNSSVQGNGIKLVGSGMVGLIAGLNSGMISYSFSTAEVIVEESIEIAGLVYTNEGKLLSNYFTGYIEGGEAVGIVYNVNSAQPGYIYNNYMAGVVTNIKANAFYACETINGSNNFIDSYSDVKYAYKEYVSEEEREKAYAILTPVQTADLMAGNGLSGVWYVTVLDGNFDTTLETFGLNYNYPIYRFNKLLSTDGKIFIDDDLEDQLYTGTGVANSDEDPNIDTDFLLEERYAVLVNSNSQNYQDAFKIPHLGVLTAMQNLLNESRNYVVIYDINGAIGKDSNIEWKAVGSSGDINGFQYSGTCKGVFVTNKYYAYNTHETLELTNESDAYCEIKNLSGNGLFDVVNDSYIGNIKLGSFYNLKNSGALGTTVEVETDNISKYAYINNVEFVRNSTISGTEYFGGLFGEIKGELIVNKFISSTGTNANVCLVGDSESITGLIAGKVSGTVDLKPVKADDGKLLSTYFAWFKGNNYAGGIAGELNGGYIKGNENTITLVKTTQNGADVDLYTSVIGGVAGLTTETKAQIENINVNIQGTEIKTNTFGGVVGEVNVETNLTEIIKITGSSSITFLGNLTENRYYGLVAGLQNANITATDFKISTISKLIVNCAENPNYDEDSTTSGIGAFIGATLNGDINIKYDASEITLEINGIPNVGGFVGYVDTLRSLQFEGDASFNISGTTNVGGMFGYLKGNILEELKDLNQAKFATIQVNGSEGSSIEHKNFGGLFGKWEGTNLDTTNTIKNYNEIVVGETGVAYNIGGIAGKVKSTSTLNGFDNQGEFNDLNSQFYDTSNSNEINSSKLDNGTQVVMCKLMNVGGVFGLVEDAIALSNVSNQKNVLGYQNVGGIVGYLAGSTIVENNTDKDMVDIRTAYNRTKQELIIYYDANNNASYDAEVDVDISELNGTSGNIYGVVNVGGVVGYAGKDVSIQKVYSTANVYGNINVGGIVGLSNQAILTNNCIIGSVEDGEKDPITGEMSITRTGAVKGIYYNYLHREKEEEIVNSFIPTSVGGLVGTAIGSRLENNLLNGAQVISTRESDGEVISTISNYMADLSIGESNLEKVEGFIKSNEIYNLDTKDKLNYSEIRTGFGGFVGTLDTATMEMIVQNETPTANENIDLSVQTNYLIDIEVEAQLGVNVGTYFGAYKFTNSLNLTTEESGESVALVAPKLFSTKNIFNPTTKVSGSYNVGGIVGYVDGGTGATTFNLSNANLYGYATINLQSSMPGIYVGGLIGKTNSNSITGLEILTNNDINLETFDGDVSNLQSVKISIHTDNCYFAGGLIGRAEVNADATISGNLGEWSPNEDSTGYNFTSSSDRIISSDQDDRFNFGALIGLLKVAKTENSLTINVEGNHKLPFTINTIENSNYYDGDSRFNVEDQEDYAIKLAAEAYYVNQDSFNIAGSQNEAYYNATAKNPLNPMAKGWSKKYTGFRIMQRNIPQSENNGAKWDSIAVLFDAAQITHVGTIGNLGLWKDKVTYEYNEETREYNTNKIVKEESDGVNDNKLLSGKEKYMLYDEDHICFTVYEQADGQAILYSRVGIATVYYSLDEEINEEDGTKSYVQNYGIPPLDKEDEETDNLWNNIKAKFNNTMKKWSYYLKGETPPSTNFLDLNDVNTGVPGLTYFNWEGEYYDIYSKGEFSYKQGANETNYLTYFVEDYLDADVESVESLYGNGAYFVFDVIYENASIPIDSLSKDTYLPSDGSIYAVTGIMSEQAQAYHVNEGAIDYVKIAATIIVVIGLIALVVVTGGAGLTGVTLKGVGASAAAAAKSAIAAWTASRPLRYTTAAIAIIMAGLTVINTLSHESSKAYNYFTEPNSYSYGFLSSTYSKEIYYKDVDGQIIAVNESDDEISNKEGYSFIYYSFVRPKDYHTNIYVGVPITINEKDNSVSINIEETAKCEDFTKAEMPNLIKDTYTLEGLPINVGKDSKNNTYWIMPKYEYYNGAYYVNLFYGEVDYRRVTMKFNPEDESVTNYTEADGNVYVQGQFDSINGYEYDNNYPGNNLVYDKGNKTYSINGETIDNSIVEYVDGQLAYKIDTVSTLDVITNNEILGYDYFDKVYFTANGQSGLIYNENQLVKYATFAYVGDYNSSLDYSSFGTLGVDYIVKDYKYNGNDYNSSGNFFKYNGVEYNLNSTKRYSYNEEIEDYEENNSGNYILVSGKYVQIQNRYSKNPIKSGVFVLVDKVFANEGKATDLTTNPQNLTEGNEITVAVYPGTFVNPYTKYSLTLQNSSHDGDNVKNNLYTWYYTSGGTNSISYTPTFYIYEGGYVANENGVFLPLREEEYRIEIDEDTYKANNRLIEDEYVIDENDKKYYQYMTIDVKKSQSIFAIVHEISFYKMMTEWDEYKDWYSVDSGRQLSLIYEYKDGVLYEINSNFLIRDGLLYKVYTNPYSEDDEIDLNEGMYLTNAEHALYTRYRYSEYGKILDFSTSKWGNYVIIPKSGTNINGQPTRLSESVRVILGGTTGKNIRLWKSGDNYQTEISGVIKIS